MGVEEEVEGVGVEDDQVEGAAPSYCTGRLCRGRSGYCIIFSRGLGCERCSVVVLLYLPTPRNFRCVFHHLWIVLPIPSAALRLVSEMWKAEDIWREGGMG